MTTKPTPLAPLDWRIGIVDQAGRPTPAFQRLWNSQRAINDAGATITIGHGKPPTTPQPADGDAYVDDSVVPFVLYVGQGGIWSQVGVVKFTDLSDAPHDYSGADLNLVQVNSGGTGLQFIPIADIQNVGFSFYAGGLLSLGEELGSGVWPTTINFDNTMTYSVTALIGPTSTAILDIKMLEGSLFVTVGTITFNTGSLTGVLNWPTAVTLPAGIPLSLWAPSPADSTLSSVSGLINGKEA